MIVNISEGLENYSQKNNVIKPSITCNTTSMVMGLDYTKVPFPKKGSNEWNVLYEQPEDGLTNFILTDTRVRDYYLQINPELANAWIDSPNSKEVTPPNEYHPVLAYGTNLWVGRQVVKFNWSTDIHNILWSLLKNNAVVVSGTWAGLAGHIVCVVGFETTQEDIKSLTLAKSIDLTKVVNVIIDDPYGNYKTKYKSGSGNDVFVPYKDYISITKPVDNSNSKWAHIITNT